MHSISSTIMVALAALADPILAGCNQDNCLRALSQAPSANSAFCQSYTTGPYYGTTNTEVALQCSSTASSISSACSCFVTPTPPTTTSTTLTTPTSMSTSTTPTSTSTTFTSTSTTSSTTSSSTPSATPCAKNVCFSTHFNSQSVPAGDVLYLSAAFKPKFSASTADVAFINSRVTINGAVSPVVPPNSYIHLDSSLQSCSTAAYINGMYETTAPLPGSGNTFLAAVNIPVPAGQNYANAAVTWCGDVVAPGEIDVQIAAAVYTSCSNAMAMPEACETHTQYHAGVPTGCLSYLVPGGTGGGGSNYSGSLSATYPVCKAA